MARLGPHPWSEFCVHATAGWRLQSLGDLRTRGAAPDGRFEPDEADEEPEPARTQNITLDLPEGFQTHKGIRYELAPSLYLMFRIPSPNEAAGGASGAPRVYVSGIEFATDDKVYIRWLGACFQLYGRWKEIVLKKRIAKADKPMPGLQNGATWHAVVRL